MIDSCALLMTGQELDWTRPDWTVASSPDQHLIPCAGTGTADCQTTETWVRKKPLSGLRTATFQPQLMPTPSSCFQFTVGTGGGRLNETPAVFC